MPESATIVAPSALTFSFHTMPASPSPRARAAAICGAVVVVVSLSETASKMPASVNAFLAILPIGVESGSPIRMVSALTRSFRLAMFLGLSLGTTRTGMCFTKSVLEVTYSSTGFVSSFEPAMKKSPSSVVLIWVWICAAFANVMTISQPVCALNSSAIFWKGSVMPAPQ